MNQADLKMNFERPNTFPDSLINDEAELLYNIYTRMDYTLVNSVGEDLQGSLSK